MIKKILLSIVLVFTLFTTPLFSAGIWNPKDVIKTPLSSQVWNCVEVWNGGAKVFEAKNVKITVWTMYSTVTLLASPKNETSWIVYTIEYSGGIRNIIDSEALSIIFW